MTGSRSMNGQWLERRRARVVEQNKDWTVYGSHAQPRASLCSGAFNLLISSSSVVHTASTMVPGLLLVFITI